MPLSPRITAYVDGSQMLYRAEFGFPSRITNRRGDDVTGVFGFLALTRKALRSSLLRPTHAIVVFDADSPSPRTDSDQRYRAARKAPAADSPTNPFRHLRWIRQALDEWGIPHMEHDRAEADDVIAALVQRDATANSHAIVISRDKDFHQILSDTVSQWDSSRGMPKGWISAASVLNRFKVAPHQWCDYLALVGDPSDGMPGLRGIGPVKARRLLHGGGSLEDLEGLLSAEELDDALAQRELHRFDGGVSTTGHYAAPLSIGDPITPAMLLEKLGIWDIRYV